MPSQRGMNLEKALRRFQLHEGSNKFPDDANHEEDEMVLDDFQVSYVEKNQYGKYDAPPNLIIDGCNDEMEIFSFPFEEEDSFHDEEIEERSFEAFKAEVPLEKGVIECSDSQDDEEVTKEGVEVKEDLKIIIDLLTRAMVIQD
ncbi:hypothetical protein KI387_006045, partial [Taxus chinensis]